jgi:ubiquinone/menaquinone biosynthesis C-methylase UbiE
LEEGEDRAIDGMRKRFQGVGNIIRFNWHFYASAFAIALALVFLRSNLHPTIRVASDIIVTLIVGSILVSLAVSCYIYDFSRLYKLSWLDTLLREEKSTVVNINAGFDETSYLLAEKYPDSELLVLDFYDPARHTEGSIKRARKAYPAFSKTQAVRTNHLPLLDNSTDKVFLILSAHEIRSDDERAAFFKELRRALTPEGQLIVVEHLRDMANSLAYNIGALHFHSKSSWLRTFQVAGLRVASETKITPFITTFILEKNGTTS